MHTLFLLLGSNLGNRQQHIDNAERMIASYIGIIDKTSSVYETEPWGYSEQPSFLNKVIVSKTNLLPHDVLEKIIDIEIKLGRIRNEKWHERIIDIDVLFYDDLIYDAADLKIPHPHLHERRFTLMPLYELVPDYCHPVLRKTIRKLLDECADNTRVELSC